MFLGMAIYVETSLWKNNASLIIMMLLPKQISLNIIYFPIS